MRFLQKPKVTLQREEREGERSLSLSLYLNNNIIVQGAGKLIIVCDLDIIHWPIGLNDLGL